MDDLIILLDKRPTDVPTTAIHAIPVRDKDGRPWFIAECREEVVGACAVCGATIVAVADHLRQATGLVHGGGECARVWAWSTLYFDPQLPAKFLAELHNRARARIPED